MKRDENKTKEQLIKELAEMRQRIAELETSETGRKQAEEMLRVQADELQALMDGLARTGIGVDIVSTDYKILFQNQTLEEKFKGLTGELCYEKYRGLKKPCDPCPMIKAVKGNKVESAELTDVKGRNYELFSAPLPNPDGTVDKAIEVVMDITERKQAEEALRESEQELSQVVQGVSIATFAINREHTLIHWNSACEKLTGIPAAEVVGTKKQWQAFYLKERPVMADFITDNQAEEEIARYYGNKYHRSPLIEGAYEAEDFFPHLGEGGKWLSFTAAPLRDQEGEVVGAIETLQDITEGKQAEGELQQSEENLKIYLESAPDGVFLCDLKGTFLYGNKKAEEIIGYKRGELIGKSFLRLKLLPAKYLAKAGKALALGAMGKPAGPDEFELIKKDGSRIWTEITAAHIKQEGKIVGIGFVRDITERKRAEEALRESEEFNSSLLRDSPNPIHVINPDTSIQYVNPALEKITGYSSAELIGQGIPYPWWPEETRDGIRRDFEGALHEGVRRFERQFRKKNGEQFWVDITFTEVKHDGKLEHYLSNWTDITERKETEELYSTLANSSQIGVYVAQDEKFQFVNPYFQKVVGFDKDDLLGTDLLATVHPEDREMARQNAVEMLKGERSGPYEFRITDTQGKTRVIMEVVTSVEYQQKRAILANFMDITEHRKAEETLRESEEKYRVSIESAPYGIIVTDPDEKILIFNSQLERITGYSQKEIPDIQTWLRKAYPDEAYRSLVIEERKTIPLKEAPRLKEAAITRKDGGKRTCQFVSVLMPSGMRTVFITDLTERKHMEAEKRELEQQAQMTSRLATVGEMASGIAHEINNPLTAVIGYADLVLERDIPQEVKDDVRIIHNGAKRVADIIKRLLTFARQYQPERTYLDINDIIEATLEFRAYELETSSIKVTTHLAPDLPRTMADAGQLQQVFLNLIINAETEMKLAHEGGKLLVKTGTVDNTLRISFKDDGPGITKENLEKIFNPFFTTREVGKGTGLGLSLCHGIIAEHKGQIYAKSKPGRGATFIVELPVITEEKQLEMAEPAEEVKKVAPARILVVDDEPAICQLLKRVLTGEGHEVETVASAGDALEKMKGTRYNLILLDIKLPGKSGIELYRHIKDATPTWAKRIVFITGDVMGTDTRSFLSRSRVPYITKPFDTEQLKRDLNRLLTRGA